jgi:HEPN domain-containing protein
MQEHKTWLTFAEGDLRTVKLILHSEDDLVIGNILYLSQQCVEKSLKAYLIYKKQGIRKTHDLVDLLHLCSDFDPEFEQFLSVATELNPYITKARYPDSHFMMPHVSVAEYAAREAEKIYLFVWNRT